jgi:hypothetical protein
MASYDTLRQFNLNEMRMSRVYQPVMLIDFLKSVEIDEEIEW